MSILSKVFKAAKPLLGAALKATPIGRTVGIATTALGVAGSLASLKSAAPALRMAAPGVGFAAGRIASAGGKLLKVGGKVAGAAATGAILYDAFGHPVKHHRVGGRRMNPMNYKALNRALRRVCRAKDLTDRLDHISIKKPPGKRKHSC